MTDHSKSAILLMADDDPDDCLLVQRALEDNRIANKIRFVTDGEDLLAYLRRTGRYSDPATSPRPSLILLDLNMPRLDGREALKTMKSDPALKSIPVIVLTTSKAEEDVFRSYQSGANSYIMKPITFEGLVDVMKGLKRFWFEIVELPNEESPNT
jgi:CheY-like chemotaxis protein